MDALIVRPEVPDDAPAIAALIQRAFAGHPHGSNNEQFIVARLRASDALSVSLVGELANRVVGHVAASPVTMTGGTPNWYGLGPVAVDPTSHGQGIGTTLVNAALSQLRSRLRRAR